jgi:hypothetical protein
MQTDTILGISLSTRRLGMAVGNKQELMEWQLKIFDQTYSKKVSKKLWRVIELAILKYDIKGIGLKFYQNPTSSEGLKHYVKYITEKALNRDIIVFFYDIQTLERYFLNSDHLNKIDLATCISDKYPELKKEYFKLSKSQYHMKIFEAVATMELALFEFLKL